MPLHDWTERPNWEGLHDVWIVELLRYIKPRLPEPFRAYIGSAPALAVGAPDSKPDVSVRYWQLDSSDQPTPLTEASAADPNLPDPDEEVATIELTDQRAVLIALHGQLVAAIELISPRNKDREASRASSIARYLAYLKEGAHLLLIDVHRRPLGFSFADALAAELKLRPVSCPTPSGVCFRVGEPAPGGGRMVAVWRRPFALGEPLPFMPLPITVNTRIAIDLEGTYSRAASDNYLT